MARKNYRTASTFDVVPRACVIESIFIGGGTMGQIDLYDAVNDATGTAFLTIAAPFPGMTVPRFDVKEGLTLKTAQATEIQVAW